RGGGTFGGEQREQALSIATGDQARTPFETGIDALSVGGQPGGLIDPSSPRQQHRHIIENKGPAAIMRRVEVSASRLTGSAGLPILKMVPFRFHIRPCSHLPSRTFRRNSTRNSRRARGGIAAASTARYRLGFSGTCRCRRSIGQSLQ